MDFGQTPGALALMALALVVGGAATGFLAGLLGIGGGAILVPVLYEIFTIIGVDEAIRMQITLGTVLAVIAPTTLRSFAGHYARGGVDTSVIWRLGPWVVAGVIAGVLVAKGASGTLLQGIWVVCGTILMLKMGFGREDWRIGDGLPKSKLRPKSRRKSSHSTASTRRSLPPRPRCSRRRPASSTRRPS